MFKPIVLMISIKVVLFTSKVLQNGKSPIMIRLTYKRKSQYLSTGNSATVNDWNYKSCRLKVSRTNDNHLNRLINRHLDKLELKIKEFIFNIDESSKIINLEDLIRRFKKQDTPTSINIFLFTNKLIASLNASGKKGNANVYKNTLGVFKNFRKSKDLSFEELDYKMLKKFEEYLLVKQLKVNTISFHMRTLRAIFNRAIKEEQVEAKYYPFTSYTIIKGKTIKRALLKEDIKKIKSLDLSHKPEVEKARDLFIFSFLTRGMSFKDLAYLKVKDIINGRLYYSRSKVEQNYSIKLTDSALEIIRRYNDLNDPGSFIFPIIKNLEEDHFNQYKNGMRLTNKKLKIVQQVLNLPIPLTTYVARHSWATIGKREGVSTAVISEGLGHETEKTTQIYLDSFENSVLDEANDLITDI
ncbi:MAG: phage integrase SAM-like domain-containing protein [Nitrososphaeraceae archaeon]